MIVGMLHGNVTRDAVMRGEGTTQVCSFGVASNEKVKGEDKTTFVDVSIWGERGKNLCAHITKGKKVAVVGPMSQREHEGKQYLQISADRFDFGGGPLGTGAKQEAPATNDQGSDDNIPF
jgi:single-stranded DNA-binding protein